MNKKIIIYTIIILIFVIITLFLYKQIILPSYISYLSICNPEKFEERFGDRYMIIGEKQIIGIENISRDNGTAVIGLDKENVIEIRVIKKDKKTLKHEIVHAHQDLRLLSFRNSCLYPIQKVMREVEANIGEKLPDLIFELIYKVELDDFSFILK